MKEFPRKAINCDTRRMTFVIAAAAVHVFSCLWLLLDHNVPVSDFFQAELSQFATEWANNRNFRSISGQIDKKRGPRFAYRTYPSVRVAGQIIFCLTSQTGYLFVVFSVAVFSVAVFSIAVFSVVVFGFTVVALLFESFAENITKARA